MERKYDRLVEEQGLDALQALFPHTMNDDLSHAVSVQDKMDGSLISTFYFDGRVYVKSKGSLHSEQAQAAQKLLDSKYYAALYRSIEHSVMAEDHTVIMEYTGPDNRIVIPTDKPKLTVLGVRDNHTGEYLSNHELLMQGYAPYTAYEHVDEIENLDRFVEASARMTGIEGYVVTLANGQRVKIKTDWYAALHHLKDSINSQRRLFEAAVNDATDDLKAQFYDDPQAIGLINEMESKVASIYNHMVDQVERFYARNKHMERKDYAIKGQNELDKLCFGLAMAKYSGKEVDYKATLIKHRKNFGIKDDPEKED